MTFLTSLRERLNEMTCQVAHDAILKMATQVQANWDKLRSNYSKLIDKADALLNAQA